MKKLLTLLLLLSTSVFASAQNVGIGTTSPNASAALEVNSTANNTGFLPPRLTAAQRDAIVTPAKGLMVFVTTDSSYYFFDGIWQKLTRANEGWSIKGNSGINPAIHYLGTADNQALLFKLNNSFAGKWDPVRGNYTIGRGAGSSNIDGFSNVAIGDLALQANTYGALNTASGAYALYANTFGNFNTANGYQSMLNNTTGFNNNASGAQALNSNTTGTNNNANGLQALYSNTIGSFNSANGYQALYANTTGSNNTALGAGADVQSGALFNATAIGANAMVDCNNCMVLGSKNGVNNAVSDVNVGIGTTSPQYRLHVAGSVGASSYITISDARYKQNILPIASALSTLMQLKGKTYHFNQAAYPNMNFDSTAQIGFIAQEIETVLPQLVITDSKGYKAVNYTQVIPLLTEAVKEQQQKIEAQQQKIELQQQINQTQQQKMDDLQKQIAELKKIILNK